MTDVRRALRALWRAPGFAIAAVLTLALGIGLSTAVFAVAKTLLVQRFPIEDQDRVVGLWASTKDGTLSNLPFKLAEIREYEQSSRALDRVAFFSYEGAFATPILDGDRLYRLRLAYVSGNYFDVLGARPVLGRTLRAEDDLPGAAPVTVISHAAWKTHFGGDSAVLGKRFVLHESGRAPEIVGVVAAGVDYPRGADFWLPVVASNVGPDSVRLTSNALNIMARLRPGATVDDARTDLAVFLARPGTPDFARDLLPIVHTFPELILGTTGPALTILTAAAALLLIIACVNVANLLLVRGIARTRETAVRVALGATHRRVARELLLESGLLGIMAVMLGAVCAIAAVGAFRALAPATLPRIQEVAVSPSILLMAAAIGSVAILVFAVAPAVMTSRVDLQSALRAAGRGSIGGRSRVTETLVAAQVAIAVVVLTFAGLIAKSFMRLSDIDLAMDTGQIIVAELSVPSARTASRDAQLATLERLVDRVRGIPGVVAVTPSQGIPLSPESGIQARLATPGQPPEDAGRNPGVSLEMITPDYFETLGIPIIRGRGLAAMDRPGAPVAVVISEGLASHHWPGEDPIGKAFEGGHGRRLVVVGVVPETRLRGLREPRPMAYFALAQGVIGLVPSTLLIRTPVAAATVIPALRQAIAEVDPSLALASATPMSAFYEEPLAQPRLNALLLATFAGAAIVLSAIALFGVLARMVRQRSREFGIRMALGATSGRVQRLVLWRGLRLALAGALVGVGVAASTSHFLSALLYQVAPTDAGSLVAVALATLLVAALASFFPARAGSRVPPAVALRSEN